MKGDRQRTASNGHRITLAACLFALGCGSVGEPLPPLLNIPGEVEDLSVSQAAATARIRWTWPPHTTAGATLRDVARFEVMALDLPADAPPPSAEAFEQLGSRIARIEGDALPEAGPGSEIRIEADLEERLGKRTAFAIRAVSGRGRAGAWSPYVIRDILRPADPPVAPRLESTAAGVRLSWPEVERAARYVVERRTEEGYGPIATVENNDYLDAAALWDELMAYRLRAQLGEGDGAVDSLPSPPAEITPTDTFAPAPPRLLRAVVTDGSVELTWAAAVEPDLAGYVVERNGEPAHEGLLATPAFRDASGLPSEPVEYRVRAIDAKGNRSEPSEPVRVR